MGNEELCVLAMMEECDAATVASAVEALTPIAKAAKAADETTCFFYASSGGGPTQQIRKLTHLGEPTAGKAQLLLLDIPGDGGYYVSESTTVTAASVKQLLD